MIATIGLFSGHRARGPKWYVDSVAGNDANSGRFAGSALRTIAAVLPRIAAGDSIGLARGSHWREQFTVPADRVQVIAYGAGSPPLLDCSDAIDGQAWSKTTGQTASYQCSIAHDVALGKTFIGCWENGVRLQWKTSVADVDATPGSYTLADTTWSPPSPVTLYVHASDGSNPGTNGKLYEYSSRDFGLTASGRTGCTIQGIQTRRNMHNDGSLILGPANNAIDCLATDGQYHNAFVSPGCRLTNVVASGAYHPAAMGLFIWNPAANGEDLYFESCQALLASYTPGMGGGFGGHGTGALGTVTFKNCTAQNCDLGFAGGLAANLVVTGCHTVGPCSYPISGDGTNTTSVAVSNFIADSVSSRLINQFANGCALTLSGVTANSPNGACGVFLNGLSNITLSITGSTLSGFQLLSADGAPGFQFTFLNNNVPSGTHNIFWMNPEPAAINSDYNQVYGGAFVQWGACNLTWMQYLAVSGQEQHTLNWYVDSVNGSDSNSGTSQDQAFATISKAQSVLAAGQTLGLACGSQFREQLTLSVNGATVVAYGSGQKPLLDCSDLISTAAWSKTAGRTKVYQATVPIDSAPAATFIGCWENDARLSYQASVAAVDATPGSYTLSDTSNSPVSPVTIYISASDGSNPETNGKRYEYARRSYGLMGQNASTCGIGGIATRRNLHANGSLVLGSSTVAANCQVADGQYHSVYVSRGCQLFGVVANGAYHPTTISMFYWNATFAGENLYFENCQALLESYVTGMGSGFGGNGSGTLGTVTYNNCVVQNCDEAFEGTLARTLVVRGCHIAGQSRAGLAVNDAASVTISNLTADSISQRLVTAIPNGANISVSGLNATSPNGACGVYLNGSSGVTLSITDSVLNGFQLLSADSAPGFQLTFLRNRVPSGAAFLFWINPVATAIDSDYNTVYAGAQVQWGATTYAWAAYKTATGQDTHSTP
jgi:hypothetical protein